MLAQSLATAIRAQPELSFELHLLLNPNQAALDAEVLKIDVAIIDAVAESSKEANSALPFCVSLRQAVPGCRLLLLMPQDSKEARQMAAGLKRDDIVDDVIDDFVFFETSLEHLLAKLATY
jgi:hypothetical protein